MMVKFEEELPLFDEVIGHLAKVYVKFSEELLGQIDEGDAEMVLPNDRVLSEAVGHACMDMRRMSELHLPDTGQQADRHKYAGFFSKWVAKLKPIVSLAQHPRKNGDILERVNAYFALYVFRSFLESDIPVNLHRELLYIFHYRDERGEMLSILAYTCEKISMLDKMVDA